jgi:hypothetical protein
VGFQGNDPQKGTRTVKIHLLTGRLTTRLGALLAAVSLLVVVTGASPGAAAPPTNDPPTAAGHAAHWLVGQVTSDGDVLDSHGNPSIGNTLQTALALAASGHEQATFDRIVTWLSAHVDDVTGTGVDADPGSLGLLLLVVGAAHLDATDFGGVDLVARLGGTLGAYEPGLYGSYVSVFDPTYSGVYDQSLSILGLAAVGAAQSSAALDWLVAQQCGGSDEFNGAWMSYRAPAAPCTAFDSVAFTGIDTNSTSLAYEALVAAGRAPTYDALAWLARTENTDGSFGYFVGNDGDPDSTALVIQAIVAGGDSPTAARWVKGADDPMTALLSYQLGCGAPLSDRGAFTFPGSGGAPNGLATEQGAWGAAEVAFPIGSITWSAAPVPCQAAVTTTTTGGATTSTTTPAALAVSTTPAFTG